MCMCVCRGGGGPGFFLNDIGFLKFIFQILKCWVSSSYQQKGDAHKLHGKLTSINGKMYPRY